MKTPLLFTPLLKVRVWGGERLKSRAPGAPAEPIGESWELADHESDTTVVRGGSFDGKKLHEIFMENKEDLCGKAVDPASPDVFPLMLKLIDPKQDLSVQVHPDDEYAGKQKAGELGKTEAWYVLESEAGAKLYRGFKPGVTKEAFAKALEDGSVADLLNGFEVKPGDVLNMPAGTVHALGAGVRIAEIQQNSDTTYRVFDWNRVGLDGKPRELHIEHALAVTDFEDAGDNLCKAEALAHESCLRECFIRSEKFNFDRLGKFSSASIELDTKKESFHILTVAEGEIEVVTDEGSVKCGKWDSALVPAAAGKYTIRPSDDASVLLFYKGK
ncbi:MAG: class I mannose-6-phosphate isomerase [Planctomycetes bacterium]|nr:class I mannose-6-phosphate isomerase [Planctomycetota bacterium]